MSLVAYCPQQSTGWGGLAPLTNAVSVYTRSIAQGIASAIEPLAPPTTSVIEQDRFDKPVSALFDALAQAVDDENPEQTAPTDSAMLEAIKLLEMLPPGIESPEPVIEPSGTIAWMWDRDEDGFLVLAVDGTGSVQRSAVVDGAEVFGRSALSDRLSRDELALVARFRLAHG